MQGSLGRAGMAGGNWGDVSVAGANRRRVRLGSLLVGGLLSAVSVFVANEARNLGRVWGLLSVLQTLCTIAAFSVVLALTATSGVPLSTEGGPLTGSFVIAVVIGVVAALVLTARRFERFEQREYTRAGWEFIPDAGQPAGATSRTSPDFGRAGPEPQRCRCNSHEYCPVHPGRGVSDMSTHPNQLD